MVLFLKKKSEAPRRRLTPDSIESPGTTGAFRRNRTLSGVKINTEESSRINIHHLSIKRQKLIKILAATFMAIVVLAVFVFNFTAIVDVNIATTNISKQINVELYKSEIQNYLNKYPLTRFKFLYNQDQLNDYIQDKIPEIEKIYQSDEIGVGRTSYSVTMRTPVASWKIENKRYYVDGNGIAFENNYFNSPILEVTDNSGISSQTVSGNVSGRFLGFIGLIVSRASERDYVVTEAVLPQNTTRQIELKIKGIDYYVKMTVDRSAGEQVEDMDRAVKYLKETNQLPTYIDVRVGGKIFYK